MFKLVKLIVLLAILVCAAIGVYMISRAAGERDAGGPEELRPGESGSSGIRVEEKYGFTSEGLGP